jgi:hypothetical protein
MQDYCKRHYIHALFSDYDMRMLELVKHCRGEATASAVLRVAVRAFWL